MLNDEHKTKRLGSALGFLERYSNEGDDFLSHIVTGDETWVAYVTPESNNSQWNGGIQHPLGKSNSSSPENHVHCLLGQTGCVVGRFSASR